MITSVRAGKAGWLLAVATAWSFAALCAQAQPLTTIYDEDFATDPSWITDQPANFHWDAANELYSATTVNAQSGPSPTRYAYHQVDYRGGSLHLEFDINPVSMGWSAGNAFGLFDERLQIYASADPDAHYIHVHPGRVDQGLHFALFVRGLNGVEHVEHIGWNLYTEGTWYRCTVDYDAVTDVATMALRERDTNVLAGTAMVTNIGGLPDDLDYLGFARDPSGDCCAPLGSGCPGYSCSAQATSLIDIRVLPDANRADITGDGIVDTRDMRAFARQHMLPLSRKFEARASVLERLPSGAAIGR